MEKKNKLGLISTILASLTLVLTFFYQFLFKKKNNIDCGIEYDFTFVLKGKTSSH